MPTEKAYRLKSEIIEKIGTDAELAKGVTEALGISPISLSTTLQRNSRRLTEFPVLSFLSDTLGRDINDLVEETNLEQVPE